MKKIYFLIALGSLITVSWIAAKNFTVEFRPDIKKTQQTLVGQTDNQGQVEVEAVPQNLAAGREASFDISFNTHSVELDFEVVKIAKLVDDQGNVYQPISWDGSSGGHHLEGNLKFPKISSQAKSIEFTLMKIGGSDRSFKWSL